MLTVTAALATLLMLVGVLMILTSLVLRQLEKIERAIRERPVTPASNPSGAWFD